MNNFSAAVGSLRVWVSLPSGPRHAAQEWAHQRCCSSAGRHPPWAHQSLAFTSTTPAITRNGPPGASLWTRPRRGRGASARGKGVHVASPLNPMPCATAIHGVQGRGAPCAKACIRGEEGGGGSCIRRGTLVSHAGKRDWDSRGGGGGQGCIRREERWGGSCISAEEGGRSRTQKFVHQNGPNHDFLLYISLFPP